MTIRGQGRGYTADKRGHQTLQTAYAAGDPLASSIVDRAADNLSPATQAAIAIAVAAEWGDAKSVAEYCQKWQVSTEWYTYTAITGKSWRRLRITCARDGEVTGSYSPAIRMTKAQDIEDMIVAQGGDRGKLE